jgi:hypothetical protein
MNEELKAQEMIRNLSNRTPPDMSIKTSFGNCPQCNLIHPPLRVGETCPNAPVNLDGITDQQINQMVVNVKNILVSQIKANKITDGNKLLQNLIIHIMKFFEEKKF